MFPDSFLFFLLSTLQGHHFNVFYFPWAFLALFCEILTATSLFHASKHSLLFEKLKKHAFCYLGSTSAMLCTLGTIME